VVSEKGLFCCCCCSSNVTHRWWDVCFQATCFESVTQNSNTATYPNPSGLQLCVARNLACSQYQLLQCTSVQNCHITRSSCSSSSDSPPLRLKPHDSLPTCQACHPIQLQQSSSHRCSDHLADCHRGVEQGVRDRRPAAVQCSSIVQQYSLCTAFMSLQTQVMSCTPSLLLGGLHSVYMGAGLRLSLMTCGAVHCTRAASSL
jgi:hypothetical protein